MSDTGKPPYPVYDRPWIADLIVRTHDTLKSAAVVIVTQSLLHHVGLIATAVILMMYFTLSVMTDESIYSHSDMGLGPGRLATFQKNLAYGIRQMSTYVCAVYAIHAIMRCFGVTM